MPKHDFFSPKAIGNRIKSKGLQKLRWWCEMCQKQCRDDNGFQMHIKSEAHQRQMKLFGDNRGRILDTNSRQFESAFLKILSIRHGTKRVYANQVYNELISDKNHVHLNSTRWSALAGFVRSLGQRNICKIDETERGWFVQWIDTSSKNAAQQDAIRKQERLKEDQEEEDRKMIQEQVQRGKASSSSKASSSMYTDLQRTSGDEKLVFAAPAVKLAQTSSATQLNVSSAFQSQEDLEDGSTQSNKRKPENNHTKPGYRRFASTFGPLPDKFALSAQSSITTQGHREASRETDLPQTLDEEQDVPWIYPDIIVKITNAELADGQYYSQKALVTRRHSPFVAEVQVLSSNDILRIDQVDLETVLPPIGSQMLIVKGDHAGSLAILTDINSDDYVGTVKTSDNRTLVLDYDSICKFNKK